MQLKLIFLNTFYQTFLATNNVDHLKRHITFLQTLHNENEQLQNMYHASEHQLLMRLKIFL